MPNGHTITTSNDTAAIDILQDSVAYNSTNIASMMNYTSILGDQFNMAEDSPMKTAVDANTLKTGITEQQSLVLSATATDFNSLKNNNLNCDLKTAVDTNSAKTGITPQQASNISLLISEPRIVGKTSIYPDVINYHRFGYGDGQNNTGPFVNNFFYMPHIDFKVIFTPLSPITQYKIRCFIDAYYSGRTYYFALSTSTSPFNIIPQTITLMRGRNSEWSSRQEEFCVTEFNTSIETYTLHTRYVFVKEVLVSATNALSSGETIANNGWILWGGKASHNSAIQTKFYYNQDTTPHTPPDHDNFGPLEIEAWSIPSYGTSAGEYVQFKYLEY